LPTVPEIYTPCANAELPNKNTLTSIELMIAESFSFTTFIIQHI